MQKQIQKKRNIYCTYCNKLIKSIADLAVALDGIYMLRYVAPYHKSCFNKVHGRFESQYTKTKASTVNSGWSTGTAILAAICIPMVIILIPTGAFQRGRTYPTEYGGMVLIFLSLVVIYRICSWFSYERHLPKFSEEKKRKKDFKNDDSTSNSR